jgi:hypothetical protein
MVAPRQISIRAKSESCQPSSSARFLQCSRRSAETRTEPRQQPRLKTICVHRGTHLNLRRDIGPPPLLVGEGFRDLVLVV